ncbi:hypothetical protein, partial [Pseudacidovorax sp. RU35E]|uniref:hypothetical protein n=1 Tax=Pseudacidovorax sp. RU35E TaxID=1907403 RepID=UPI001F31ED36
DTLLFKKATSFSSEAAATLSSHPPTKLSKKAANQSASRPVYESFSEPCKTTPTKSLNSLQPPN